MIEILTAIGILGGLGLLFGLVLAAASKIFYVETDPRLEKLNECLPGANCGGCGYAGCGGYAEAVLNGEAPIGRCNSGGDECAQAMAAIMGVQAMEVTRRVAMVRCSGYRKYDSDGQLVKGVKSKAQYEGFNDCLAALVRIFSSRAVLNILLSECSPITGDSSSNPISQAFSANHSYLSLFLVGHTARWSL